MDITVLGTRRPSHLVDILDQQAMVRFLHISRERKWKPSTDHRGRYSFPTLFLSTRRDHAATYWRYTRRHYRKAYAYEVKLIDELYIPEIDFEGKDTYQASFRNLIKTLSMTGKKAYRIKNCVDYPHKDFAEVRLVDIIVIFDMSVIATVSELTVKAHNA